ncbi:MULTISPECIES: hypothetical protein [Cupriavidus]|uniref:Uncharacterized protein n=1 Tax=Cupriavidus pinatubonensis (strain JMP 134 / LMG 1197) TaxID=264198 RepID=Q472V3_CUPPJ|nr:MULTISPECIES: hypothetical protein [Cupriavidus]QYY32784.1 hypothetical protein K2O51_18705 [Cupriavidus pinatubonensis]
MPSTKKALRSKPVSTAPGLVSLLYHLVHATSQGLLDPELARDLGRLIYSEIETLQSASPPSRIDMDLLREAASRFDDTVLQARSSLLIDAKSRIPDLIPAGIHSDRLPPMRNDSPRFAASGKGSVEAKAASAVNDS